MFSTLSAKKVCVLGFAFKANTSDTRETPAKTIVERLLEENASVTICDPQALKNAQKDLADKASQIIFEHDVYTAVKNAHAIVIATEWPIYKTLDYARIYASMEKPAFIFDGRNIIDRQKCFDIGFNVFSIGTAPLKHFD